MPDTPETSETPTETTSLTKREEKKLRKKQRRLSQQKRARERERRNILGDIKRAKEGGIPTIIPKKQRQFLESHGVTKEEIKKMTPKEVLERMESIVKELGWMEKKLQVPKEKERKEKEQEELIETIKGQVAKIADSEIKVTILREQIDKLDEVIEDVEISPEEQRLQEIRSWFTGFKRALRLIDKETYSKIKADIKRIEGAEDKLKELKGTRGRLRRRYSDEQKRRAKELEALVIAGKRVESFSQLPEKALKLRERNVELEKKIESETNRKAKEKLRKELKEGEDALQTIEVFRYAWQEEAREYVAQKIDADWVNRQEERLRDRKQYIERLGQAVEGESSVVAWQRAMEGLNRLYGEEVEEPENVPEVLKGSLRDRYREQVDRLAQELLAKIGWKVPESEKEQQEWLRGKIVELRRLGLAPDLITSSSVWLDLVQWLSKKGVKDNVREEFTARLDILRFGLKNTKLADPTLQIESFYESSGFLPSTKTVLAIPEVQLAYDLLEGRAQIDIKTKREGKERLLSPLSVNNSEKKGELLEELAKEFCRKKRQKLSEENLSEAKAFLGEAFDIYFYLGNLQYIEKSLSRPDSVRKVVDFARIEKDKKTGREVLKGWVAGKFPYELVRSFARSRYQDEKGEPIGGQSLGVGVRKPLHALFAEFKVKDLIGREGMDFKVSRGKEKIFNWQGSECIGVSPEAGKKTGGTWIFEKGGMRIETIVYQQPGKKDKKLIVVNIEDSKAEVIAEALSRVKEGWLPGYIRELRNGEKTRLVLLDKGLMYSPIGSVPGEIETYPSKRLFDAASTGDLFAAVPPRRYDEEPSPHFDLKQEDLIEAYLKGVFDFMNSERGKKIEGYRVGGSHAKAAMLTGIGKQELITPSGESRLEKEFFGGHLMMRMRATISLYTSVFRVPGMKLMLVSESIGNFFKLLFGYVFEGFVK